MNELFFTPTDDIYQAQMTVAQSLSQKLGEQLDHLASVAPNALHQDSVLNFYPSLNLKERASIVLDTLLETIKDYMFSEGLPVSEKVSLLQYYFELLVEKDTNQTMLRNLLDQTLMSNHQRLACSKQNYLKNDLAVLQKWHEPVVRARDLQRDTEEMVSSAQHKLNYAQMMDEGKATLKSLEAKIVELQDKQTKLAQHIENSLQIYRNAHQELFTPLKELSYDHTDLRTQMMVFWKEIKDVCLTTQQSAIPAVLSATSLKRDLEKIFVSPTLKSVKIG